MANDYTHILSSGLHNDNDTKTDGEGLYFKDGKVLLPSINHHFLSLTAIDLSGDNESTTNTKIGNPENFRYTTGPKITFYSD